MTTHRTLSVLALSVLALGASGRTSAQAPAKAPARAPAAAPEHKPEEWFVSVNHRIDLDTYAQRRAAASDGTEIERAGRSHVINLTSGVLVDADGHVVTRLVNLDPTAPRQDVNVTTSTGAILDAAVVGLDQPTGLVVLSVPKLRGTKPAPAAPATLHDGDSVRVVTPEHKLKKIPAAVERVAIYPTLRSTVGRVATTSVSLALARCGVVATVSAPTLTSSADVSFVEATDGKIAGLVMYVSPGQGQVLPFAFVRDVVAGRVVEANGSVQAGWLGAVGTTLADVPQPNRPAWAKADAEGVLIQTISANGPAEAAGLKRDDLVVKFDESAVTSSRELAASVGATPAGTKIELGVLREGQPLTVSPVLGARSLFPGPGVGVPSEQMAFRYEISSLRNKLAREADAARRDELRRQLEEAERRLAQAGGPAALGAATIGITGQSLSSQEAASFGVPGGVYIKEIAAASAAAEAGLRATDVIVRAGGTAVPTSGELDVVLRRAALSGAPAIALEVRRYADFKTPVTVTIKLEAITKAAPR